MTCETQAQEGGKFGNRSLIDDFLILYWKLPTNTSYSHVDFVDFVCAGQARQCRTHRLHRLHPLQHKYRLRQRPLRQSMHSGVGEEVEAEAEAEDKLGEEGIGMMHEEEADSRAPLGSFAQRAMESIKRISSWESVLQSGRKPTRMGTFKTSMESMVILPDVWRVISRIPTTLRD